MSSSSSSWAKKLEKKLATLDNNNASKESLQTVANWITFNRKHSAVIAATLVEKISDSAYAWQLVHEIVVSEKDNPSKWEKLLDLRVALGEGLVSVLEKSTKNTLPDSLESNLKEWADLNAFGGPSLMSQLKRLYQQSKNGGGSAATETVKEEGGGGINQDESKATTDAAATKDEQSTAAVASAVKKEEKTPEMLSKPETGTQRRSSFSQNNNRQVEYDFESKNVPARKVETKEFLEPCKAIATLQIARDLRSDKHQEISSAIASLNPEILQACQDMADGKEVDEKTLNEYSFQIPGTLLDLNMTEEQSQLQTFQDILQQQIKARKKLIHLLLESRCQFGSDIAAKEYSEMGTDVTDKLKKRKELLSDALELEGLDTSEIEAEHAKQKKEKGLDVAEEEELPPLTWYNNPPETEGSATKKQRVD